MTSGPGSLRSLVCGEDADSNAILMYDTRPEPIRVSLMPGMEFVDIFGSDRALDLPSDGSEARLAQFFPRPGGFRFWTLTFPPAQDQPMSPPGTEALREFEQKLPGVAAILCPNGSGFAHADVVEWVLVLSGEIDHELGNGQRFSMRVGDSLVQIGTRHRWIPTSDRPCVIAVATIGAQRLGNRPGFD